MTVEIVAEIGCEHGGSRGELLRLVDAAAAAGADSVKTQVFAADRLVCRLCDPDQWARMRMLELSDANMLAFQRRARSCGLKAFASAFSPKDALRCADAGFDRLKIASSDIAELATICTSHFKRTIISTGMADESAVWAAHRASQGWSGGTILLVCTSAYPCPDDAAGVGRIRSQLSSEENRAAVGYSDHTRGCLAAQLAVAAGACMIEKHLTLGRGPDAATALMPEEFRVWADHVRAAERAMGDGVFGLNWAEAATADKAVRSQHVGGHLRPRLGGCR